MKTPRLLFAVAFALGLLRVARADEGAWTNQGLPNGMVRALAADPVDPLAVYASVLSQIGNPGGTFKSADGARSWTRIDDSQPAALVVDPTEPSTVYAGGEGVLRSLDGGMTWSPVNDGLSCRFVGGLALDPENPATLLAGTAFIGHTADQCAGLFRSVDTGSSWSEILVRVIGGIAVDPRSSQNILAIQFGAGGGSPELIRTVDGGASWTFVVPGPPGPIFVLADPATPNLFYVGSDGVWLSRDGGVSWQSAGLAGQIVTALAIDPTDAAVLYAGTQLDGVWRSLDGGQSWNEFDVGLTNRFVTALAIDATGTRIYAGTNGGGVFEYERPTRRATVDRGPRPTRELPPRP
jgi:photosystem II stability/assembly factor-like uncharacterized protein